MVPTPAVSVPCRDIFCTSTYARLRTNLGVARILTRRREHEVVASWHCRGTPRARNRRNKLFFCASITNRSRSASEILERAKRYTSDLTELGLTMPLIRRNVAGVKNDLKALKVYQEALDGIEPVDEDDWTRLELVLLDLNSLRLNKAEEELFWAERDGQIVSPIIDNAAGLSEKEKSEVGNIVANITMWSVQGAVWNALILLIIFITLVNFVLK